MKAANYPAGRDVIVARRCGPTTFVEATHDLTCEHDLDGNLLSLNAAAARLLEIATEQWRPTHLREVHAGASWCWSIRTRRSSTSARTSSCAGSRATSPIEKRRSPRFEPASASSAELIHEDDVARAEEFFEEQSKPAAPARTIDVRMHHRDDSWRWFSFVARRDGGFSATTSSCPDRVDVVHDGIHAVEPPYDYDLILLDLKMPVFDARPESADLRNGDQAVRLR